MIGPKSLEIREVPPSEDRTDAPVVILLNGIGPELFTVHAMAAPLSRQGYRCISIIYPSTRYSIAELADHFVGPVVSKWSQISEERGNTLHFVTFSMGGILLRQLMKLRWRPKGIGNSVSIAPPNQGSMLADRLKPWTFFRWALGHAGQELTTDRESTPKRLGAVDFPLGVVAGDVSFDPWFSWAFDGRNDGKVLVEHAKVEGMKDFCTVSESHYSIVYSPEVLEKTVHFLKFGTFGGV